MHNFRPTRPTTLRLLGALTFAALAAALFALLSADGTAAVQAQTPPQELPQLEEPQEQPQGYHIPSERLRQMVGEWNAREPDKYPKLDALPPNPSALSSISSTLTLTPQPDFCTETLTAETTAGGEWTGECFSEGRTSVNGQIHYARYYEFTLAQLDTVSIALESAVDTYLYLREGVGTMGSIIAENDDRGNGDRNSAIRENLAAGTYTIEATTYQPAQTGQFTIALQTQSTATPTSIHTPTSSPTPDTTPTPVPTDDPIINAACKQEYLAHLAITRCAANTARSISTRRRITALPLTTLPNGTRSARRR